MVKFDNNNNEGIDTDVQHTIRPEIGSNANPNAESASKIKELEEKPEVNGLSDAPKTEIATQEDTAGAVSSPVEWKNNVTGNIGGLKHKKFGFSSLKKFLPLAAVVSLVAAAGIVFFMLFGSLFGSIDFVATVVDDLSYQVAAQKVRHLMMKKNILARSEAEGYTIGCGKLSLRCRFKSMTAKQIAKYHKAGIQINYGDVTITTTTKTMGIDGKWTVGEPSIEIRPSNGLDFGPPAENFLKGNKVISVEKSFTPYKETITGRFAVKNIVSDGVTYHSKNWVKGYTNSLELRVKNNIVNNLKTKILRAPPFIEGVLKKFGVSTKPAGLKGKTSQEKIAKLMIKNDLTSLDDIKWVQVADDQWKIEGGVDTEIYTNKQKLKVENSVKKVKTKMAPMGKSATQALKALSIIGYVDAGCTLIDMVGSASIAAKSSNARQMVDYSMPIISYVGKLKTNEVTNEEVSTMTGIFGNTDNRKMVYDPMAEKEAENPNYNESINDSELYQMSKSGDVPNITPNMLNYSLGMSTTRLQVASKSADFVNKIVQAGTDINTCKIVQNWMVRGLGLLATIITAIASEGTELAWSAAQAVGIAAAFMAVGYMINGFLEETLISGDMTERTNETATILWTSISVMQAELAKTIGMIPGNKAQIAVYNELQNQSRLDDIATESRNSKPWDIKNPYSFVGIMANIVSNYIKPKSSISSSIAGVTSMISGSLASAFAPQKLLAKSFDPKRYEQCDDVQYKDSGLNIDPDIQCNLSYIMPTADLELDTDETAEYMESKGYVAQETETGLPVINGEEYTPPDTGAAQEATEKDALDKLKDVAFDFGKGFVKQFYDKRTRFYSNKYAKYLDFCVYRSMPYGETYGENGAIGDVETEWLTGKKCLDTTDPEMGKFRAYTMDVSLISTLEQ